MAHAEITSHDDDNDGNVSVDDDLNLKDDDNESLSSSTPSLTTPADIEDHDVEKQLSFIDGKLPATPLEVAQRAIMKRQIPQIERLTTEVRKLKTFIAKRKQAYKRKRKHEGAPTRPLSAYNLYVRERFAKLAKHNDDALHSEDLTKQMRRVPPASLVASTGSEWKDLPEHDKMRYIEMAASDKRRYDDQMKDYSPPDIKEVKKRNKTGYNMFFSAYVTQLKDTAAGVPPERGSVARVVGIAWKELTSEEKHFYESEAEKRNNKIQTEFAFDQALDRTAVHGSSNAGRGGALKTTKQHGDTLPILETGWGRTGGLGSPHIPPPILHGHQPSPRDLHQHVHFDNFGYPHPTPYPPYFFGGPYAHHAMQAGGSHGNHHHVNFNPGPNSSPSKRMPRVPHIVEQPSQPPEVFQYVDAIHQPSEHLGDAFKE